MIGTRASVRSIRDENALGDEGKEKKGGDRTRQEGMRSRGAIATWYEANGPLRRYERRLAAVFLNAVRPELRAK